MFLQHELNQEAQKSRQVKKPSKENLHSPAKDPGKNSPALTPRKNRSMLFGDGFDDGEEMIVSPSKSRGKSKPATPKHGGKRKRNVTEASPVPALTLQEPLAGAGTPTNADAGREEPGAVLAGSFRPDDEKFQVS